MRTFASRTDQDLISGTSIATVAITFILSIVGTAGLLAVWTGAWPGKPPQDGVIAFFFSAKAASESGRWHYPRDGCIFEYSRIRQLSVGHGFD